ncbi:MAG: hypothetical protein JXR96_16830 [Deltaproteobacteria bacterium]|nr:hypothetical protein [Deltaproteobacteria bacterium]
MRRYIKWFFIALLATLLAAPVASARKVDKVARCKRTCKKIRNDMAKECAKLKDPASAASCRKNFLPKIEKDCMKGCTERNKKKKRRRRR